MTGPARSSDKLTMGSILKSLLHTSLSMLLVGYACACLCLCLSVLVLVCACDCLCLWCLMPWNITKRRCPLSYSGSDESKRWWIVAAMYLCAFFFSFLMFFASGLTSTHISREKPVFHVHRIYITARAYKNGVSTVNRASRSACEMSLCGRGPFFRVICHAECISRIHIPTRWGILTYQGIQLGANLEEGYEGLYFYSRSILQGIPTFLRHFCMLQAISGWPGRPPRLLGFALTWGELGKNKPYNPWPLFSSADGHTHPRA